MSARGRYRETQPATVIRVAMGISILFVVALLTVLDLPAAARIGLVAVAALEAVLLFLLHSMTVEVAGGELRVSFGPGLIRRAYPVARIVRATPVQQPWHAGRGVRLSPRSTMMIVSGGKALELELEGGRRILLGSPAPERLAEAIEAERARD